MDTEKGTVQRVENGWAWVETTRKGGCDRCSQKGHCHLVGDGSNRMIIKAENVARASSGDLVEVFLSTKTRLKGIFIVYMFPVLGLLAGAIVGSSFSKGFGWNGDGGTVLFAVSGLILAFLLAKVFESRMKANRELTPIVSRIIRRVSTGSPAPQREPSGSPC
jgi:sigma-E factor negative regulatory protein RseC